MLKILTILIFPPTSQDIHLGLFRSDYMLHQPHDNEVDYPAHLKQVEFNTYSVAGGVHSARISKMHR